MISIKTHLNRPDAVEYLEGLALDHWKSLNGVCANGDYKKYSLTNRIYRLLNESETEEYQKIYANGDSLKLQRQQNFFQMLLDFENFYLQEIIISKPVELASLRVDLMKILLESDLYTLVNGMAAQTPFGALLSNELFAYKTFRGSSACTRLIASIGFGSTTCPYCNYNKLDLVPNLGTSNVRKETVAYLDLDHFFAKVQNPFFALSFFNLIPSCHSCNSVDKGGKSFSGNTQIHPYFESFDDYYRFRVSLTSVLGDPVDEISIDPIISRPLDRTIVDFNLLAKYNNNLVDAKALISRFIKYKSYIGTNEESMFVELLLGDIPVQRENILRHSTAKFKRDLLAQLDIGNVLKLR